MSTRWQERRSGKNRKRMRLDGLQSWQNVGENMTENGEKAKLVQKHLEVNRGEEGGEACAAPKSAKQEEERKENPLSAPKSAEDAAENAPKREGNNNICLFL